MSSGTLFDFFKSLPTPSDLARWEEEHARMGMTIKDLTEKQSQLAELIRIAASIHGGREATSRGIGNANTGRGLGKNREKGTWMTSIAEIVARHPEGVSYEQVRAEMPEPYASKLSRDPQAKSFYGAIAKLVDAGKVSRHRARLFTPEGLALHEAKVAGGEIADFIGQDYRKSPIADETKRFLAANPASRTREIKAHLCKFEEFRTSIMRNASTIYNLLKKLKDREEILHHSDGTYSLVLGDEAPNGIAAGASEAGKVAAFPIDNQPTLRLIG